MHIVLKISEQRFFDEKSQFSVTSLVVPSSKSSLVITL